MLSGPASRLPPVLLLQAQVSPPLPIMLVITADGRVLRGDGPLIQALAPGTEVVIKEGGDKWKIEAVVVALEADGTLAIRYQLSDGGDYEEKELDAQPGMKVLAIDWL